MTNGTETIAQPPRKVALSGHIWRTWSLALGPWTSPEFPEWEIIRAVRDGGEIRFMIYGPETEYYGSVPELEKAAVFVAGHA
jgi:hypothetical protein